MKEKIISFTVVILFIVSAFGQSKSDAKIGENQYKLLGLTYGYYDNQELLTVVEEVGHKLEEHLDLDYKLQYHLLDLEEPNAFATPGGYVYVTRGLLALINTKDELAGILGHELSHVVLKHGSKKSYGNILPSILKLPGNIIGLVTPGIGNLINFPIEYTTEAAMSGFSRGMEKNADINGTEVATKAGYYPYALADFLIRLNDYAEFLVDHEMEKSIFNDHPMTPKRVKKLNEINEKKGIKRSSEYAGTEIKEINELIYGQNPKGGLINDSAFIHPDLELFCIFPPKWTINNSPEAITALSKDKKTAMLVSIAEDSTIDLSVKACLKKYSNSKVLKKQKVIVNGLEGYRIALEVSTFKEASRLLEIMWIELPSSESPLVVQAISRVEDFPKSIIESSFETFRKSEKSDLGLFEYSKVILNDSNFEIKNDKKLLDILNNLENDKEIKDGYFLKSIEQFKLSE